MTKIVEQSTNHVGWAMLVQELDDAREHVASMLTQMVSAGRIDEEDFAVQLGHVYAHLNRAWNGRQDPETATADEGWNACSDFPADLNPVG